MLMKRLFCILLALTACVSLSAQQRGDKAISVYAGGAFSNAPYTAVQAAGEFNYFVADNFRLSFAVGVPFTSTTVADNLKQNTIGEFYYENYKYKDSSNQIVDKSDSFSFTLNSGNVCCRFYL